MNAKQVPSWKDENIVCHGAIDIFIAPNIHLSSRSESSPLQNEQNKKIFLSLENPISSFYFIFFFFSSLTFSVDADVISLTCHLGVMRETANGAIAVGFLG